MKIRLGLGLGTGTLGAPSIYPPGILARWEAGLGVTAEPTDPKYVSAWADQVGTYNMAQPVQIYQPLYVPGDPSLQFDGGNNNVENTSLGTALGNGVTDVWLALVFKLDDTTNQGIFYLGDAAVSARGELTVYYNTGNLTTILNDTFGNSVSIPFSDTVSRHVLIARLTGGSLEVMLDGVSATGVVTPALDLSGLVALLGAYYRPSNYLALSGALYEIAIGPGALTETDAIALSSALASKWGI